jgi:Sugar phosphate isomerases/epimerases
MLQIKVGVQLASLGLPLKQGLLTARELGAEAVEIDARHELRPEELSQTGVRQIRKLLDDLNLRVSCLGFRTRRGYHIADDLEARIDATKRALRLAYDLGTNVVVNHIGRVPADDDAGPLSTMVQALTDLGRYSQRVGAFLAAETASESGPDLAKLIERLPPGSIGVDLNPAQLIIHGHSPLEAARALGPHVMHIHANDAARDVSAGRGIEVQLGRGSAEFPELLGVLEEHQYRGYITIERRDTTSAIADVRQAIEFLRNL